jgi:hypothetical protein
MGGLYARLQEIIGEKIFRHKVTFDGDVVFKKHITAYAPVPGEPSLGTPHPHYATILNVDPASTAVQTLSLAAHLPVGAKMIALVMELTSTNAGDSVIITNAAGTAYYGVLMAQVNGQDNYGYCLSPVDASLNIYWKVNNVRVTSVILYSEVYWD